MSPHAKAVLVLSLLLMFFTIPHTLEDFALGEPAKNGLPASLLSLVIASVYGLQALGLFGLGQGKRWGLGLQGGVGLFWALASGLAQLPSILSGVPYRAGFISEVYVLGTVAVGLTLVVAVLWALYGRKV